MFWILNDCSFLGFEYPTISGGWVNYRSSFFDSAQHDMLVIWHCPFWLCSEWTFTKCVL